MLGEKIGNLRRARNLTKKELAKRVGVSLSTIRNWELNDTQPPSLIIGQLCRALGTDPNELFGFNGHTVVYLDALTDDDRILVNTLVQTLQNKNMELIHHQSECK